MKKTVLNTLALASLLFAGSVNAQVGIGVPTENIHPSAELEVKSTTKGFLPPRMTKVERNSIATPAAGLLIYQTDGDETNPTGLYYFDGTDWKNGIGAQGEVGIKGDKGDNGQQGTAATFPNGTVSGQILYWNGNKWVASPPGENGQTLTLVYGLPVWQKTLDATTFTAATSCPCPATLKIKTGNISDINGISAVCGGEIFGSVSAVSAAGVCWSTSPNPIIATNENNNSGSSITQPVLFVKTPVFSGSATTGSVTNSFTEDDPDDGCGGGAQDSGMNPNFSVTETKSIEILGSNKNLGVGKFTSQIKGLTQNTTYYVRAYATNDEGTYYGEQIIFTTNN